MDLTTIENFDTMSDEDKILALSTRVDELNKILAFYNGEKMRAKSNVIMKDLASEETELEVFNLFGGAYTNLIISKHKKSEFVRLALIQADGKTLQLSMTEKSYMQLFNAVEIFKIKYINTRQFENQ